MDVYSYDSSPCYLHRPIVCHFSVFNPVQVLGGLQFAQGTLFLSSYRRARDEKDVGIRPLLIDKLSNILAQNREVVLPRKVG